MTVVAARLTRELLTRARRAEIDIRVSVLEGGRQEKRTGTIFPSRDESVVVTNKESNQCVHPHATSVSTSTHTYVYHQGHITVQDVGDRR